MSGGSQDVEEDDYFDIDDYDTDCVHACSVCPICDCTCTDEKDDQECFYHTFGEKEKA